VPPRPADFVAPAPGSYGYPARALLEWGWELDQERIATNARNVSRWRPAVPDLVRMATDEGLLEGWPGEKAGWAPYHALHMLGYLRAHQEAGPLLALLGRENDWLSDQLPAAWGRMGSAAGPALWEYAGNSSHPPRDRGTVYLGLAQLAVDHPRCRADVAGGLIRLLSEGTAADAEANACLVHVLDRLGAVEARDAIAAAFQQGKVDRKIMEPADVSFLDEDTLDELYANRFDSARGA
jgi:hypothetical protein